MVKTSQLITWSIAGVGVYLAYKMLNLKTAGAEQYNPTTPNIITIPAPNVVYNVTSGEKVPISDFGKVNVNNLSSSKEWVKAAGGKLPQIIPTAWDSDEVKVAAAQQFIKKPLSSAQKQLAIDITNKFGRFDSSGKRLI
jgi:hypothetical protein